MIRVVILFFGTQQLSISSLKNYNFSNSFKLFLTLFLCSFALITSSQNDFNVQFQIPAGNFNRLSVCGDAQTHTVRFENISGEAITDGTVKMDLPVGMVYVSGSLTGPATEANLTPPIFDIGNFAIGEVKTITYDLDITCDGLALAQSSASVNYLLDMCYTGADTEQNNIGAPKFEVVNPTLSFPTIVGNVSSTNLFDGAFGLTDTLKVHLVNGGEGNLRELTYCVRNNHPNLSLNSIVINGMTVPQSGTSATGDSLYFLFDADEFATAQTFAGNDVQDPSLFQFNERLIVCEVWEVSNCPDPDMVIPDLERIAFYGCDGVESCQQTATTYTGVRFGVLAPGIRAAEYYHHYDFGVPYRDRPYYTDCYDDPDNLMTYSFAVINTGSANMKLNEFDLEVHAHNYYYIPWALDENSVNFYFKDGATTTPVPDPGYTDAVGIGEIISPTHQYITNCHEGDPTAIWRVEYRDANLTVPPGDTLMIEYSMYRDEGDCGTCSGVYSQYNLPYPQIQNIEYSDECDIIDFASINSGVAPRIRNYNSTFSEGTNNFFSGAVSTTCWNVTAYENFFFNYNCPGNGQPQVGSSYDSDRYHINSPNAYVEEWYVLPEGLDWVGTSGDLDTDCITWIDPTGAIYPIYDLEYTDHDCGPDTLKVRYQGSQNVCFNKAQSKFTIKTTPDCGEAKEPFCSKTVNITRHSYYVTECDTDGTKCFEKTSPPRPHTATIHGCFCNPCEGMVFTYLNLSRQTFGDHDPDNDGITEPGTLDTALINTSRFITGDTIRATYGGWVNLIDKPNFEYAYATINVPIIGSGVNALGDDGITPLSAMVQIWDRSTGDKYECDLVQLFPDGQKVVANISAQSLINLGCTGMPADFVYEQGDSVAVDFDFRLKDYTTTQQSVNFGSEFYMTDEPYDTGTHYQCNTLNQTMTYIPYRAYNEWVYREIGGCNDAMDNSFNGNSYNPIASVYDSHRNLFRLGSTGFDYFPFEVRELAKITKQTYVNNSDLEWGDVFRMLIYDNNGHLTETGSSLSWQRYTLDMTTSSCFAISGNTLVVDFECVYAEVGYERFDEGMDMYATPALSPTCNSEYEDGGTYKDIEVYTEYDMLESMFCSPTWTAIDTSIGKNDGEIDPFNQALEPHFMHHRSSIYAGDYIQLTELPKITLQPLSVNQTLLEEEACFRVDVSNTGSGPANNVFFTLENISGAVVFQGVKDAVTGADIPVNLGVVDLGVMDVGETRELEFCVTSNNCDRDSIQINTGWDCNGLPTSPQEANCTDPVSVYLEIPEAELSMVVLSPDPAIPYFMDLCTEVEHVIQLSSSNIGSIHDINFQFTVPPGMDFVPGSFEIAYPVPSGGAPTWVTTGNQPVNTTGNQYNLVLDPENPLLAANGLPGTTDIGNNFLLVKFDVFVGCGSYSGSRVRFLTWAYDSCDEFTNYRFNPGPVIKINGVADSYVSALSVPDDEVLNACEGNSIELGVNFSLAQGSLPIGPTDSVMVILPVGINYVPGSYTVNMNGEPPSATNPRVVNDNGSETVFFDLLDGVTAGNAVDFTFEVAAMDVAQTCRDYEMIIRTFNSQGVFCDATGEFCDVKTTSDEVSATIEIIKPDLDVSNLEISSCAAPPDMEEMTYCFDLTNTEAPISAGTTTTVEFYDDTNDNGDFNPGVDVFLASVTTTDPIPTGGTITVCDKVLVPSGMTCNVLAVINPETTCACGVGTSYRAYAALDQKMTTDEWIVCSNDPITDIGPDALDNVTYEWVGINGASTVGFSSTTTTPTNYQFQNTTGSTIVWEYYLRAISNEDCASLDTIQITIYPEEHGEVTLQACPFDEYTLEGPTGKTNYQWTPSVGLSDPNASTTDVSASVYPIGVHEFVLTYTDENGCPGDFTTEVTVVKCALTYVGNYVWCDDNNNGIQDDAPVEGFTVQLFGSTDPTTPVASTTTDANGAYLFGPIPQGEYIIGLDLQGSNYQVAMKDATTDDLDNDLNPNFQTDPFYLSNGDSLTTIDLGVLCPVVDIELTKTAVTNKETNLAEAVLVGDTVYWTIEVCNRVMAPDTINFRADSIQVIDTLPSSLTYLSYTSTQGTYDPVSGIWDVGNIGSGGCPSLCIATRVAVDELPICNIAEVSRVTDPEIDSTPANDDGDQSEDDEDKAYIYEKRMDLALTKVVSTSQMLPVEAGNDVTFTIEICNQGNVPAYNVQVVDYIPAGMTLNDSDWTPGGLPTEAFITLPDIIDINTCEQVDITLQIDPSFAGDTLTNFSEISHQEYDDGTFAPDIDSDTDDDPGNDGPVTDQETMNASGDQDDHDPAGIHIEMLECTAGNNGPVCPGTAVTLTETGGEAISWSWSGPGGFTSSVQSPAVNPALPGVYTVSVTDVNGFMETCTTEVSLLPGIEVNGLASDVSCNGGSDGSIDINVSGGTAPYSYDWDNDGAENPDNDNQDLSNVTAGTYVVTVTDALGCFVTASYTVVEPTAVTCNATSNAVLCYDGSTGSVTVSATGGTMPYEYSINGGAWQPGTLFSDLSAGTYNIGIRDANNCVAICQVNVSEPDPLSCTNAATDLTDCIVQDGEITTTASGGVAPYSYSINGGAFVASNIFENLIAGTHVIVVKDANGCTSSCEAMLTAPSMPMCTISAFEHIACNGGSTGSITVTPSGGNAPYEYSLDNTTYQSGTTFSGLSAGLHQIYIRNTNSPMCISMCSMELLEPTLLICSNTHTDISCADGSDGTITIDASGGVTPYEYSINGGPWQPGSTFTSLTAGTYTVTTRDANNCIETCTETLMQPAVLTCTLSSTNVTCKGTSTGSISVLASGGVIGYEYSLNNGPWQVSNQFVDIPAGVQSLSVRDANDCISSCTVTITEPEVLSCTLGATDVTDCSVSDGVITALGLGGTTPYNYAIDGGESQTSGLFEGLMPGAHTVLVTDANGCTSTCEITISAPMAPSCQITAFENIACKDGETGSITVAGSGGSAPYEYSLDNITYQSSSTFSGLTAGIYSIYVRNASSPMCISTCSKELTEPTELICQHTNTSVSCNGGDDATILINATGGVTPYEYSLDGSPWQPGFEFEDLEAGSYTVTLRDANNCTSICQVVVNEPSAVSCSVVSANAFCYETATGMLIVSATGGTGAYEYNIDNGPWQISNQFTGLPAGSYVVTTRDENSCTSQCNATVGEPALLECSLTGTDLTDCDVDDGTVSVAVTGGTGPFSYAIDGGNSQSSANFNGLMAGGHTVMVTDANGCTASCMITLTVPTAPNCEITAFEHIDCKGDATGSITVAGSGGNAPYEYSLDNVTFQSSGVFSDLVAGVHVVYVRNVNSPDCATLCSMELTEPTLLICDHVSTDASCKDGSDGSATINATGGITAYEYSLDGSPWQPSNTFNGLAAGSYTATVRDANGCTTTCSFTISEPTLLVCELTKTDVVCNGDGSGSITTTASGGVLPYDYSLDGGSYQSGGSFTNVTGGMHTVSVRDGQNCISTCSIFVDEPDALNCTLEYVTPETCAFDDGEISIIADGGVLPYTFSIDGGLTTQPEMIFSGLPHGDYVIDVIDNNGCSTTCVVTVEPSCFDLALEKTLVTDPPYVYGQYVVFEIEVENEGNIDATDVEITDHIPCGFSYEPGRLINLANDWSPLPTSFPMTTIESLDQGEIKKVQIELKVEECIAPGGYINVAEISEAHDEEGEEIEDIDSTPDYDPNNDPESEDDHDTELLPIYDPALIKTLVSAPPYSYGSAIEFKITICNQNSNQITNVNVVDYMPVGYSFDPALNTGWTLLANNVISYTYNATILQGGECADLPLFLTVEMAAGYDDWRNVAEINSFTDENGNPQVDTDADNDAIQGNDGDMEDNISDNTNDDEDDSDYENIQLIDLALAKTTLAVGPFSYGDQVTFDIAVVNQGNQDAYNILVNDFIPCGYEYLSSNDGDWSYDVVSGIASTTFEGPLVPGTSDTISIILEVQPCAGAPTEAWTNISEIENFEDENGEPCPDKDIDSQPDKDPGNDSSVDNVIDNTDGDEDDNDFEKIKVFDLAQIKQAVTAGPYAYGDLLEYKITLINQGNVAATNVILTDHLPDGLSFDSANNIGWDATNAPSYDYTVVGPLLSGDTVYVPIFVTLEMTSGGSDNYTNVSEISSAQDEDGNPAEDADSDPDSDPNNDGDPVDDATEDPNEEDDHDPETIEVVDLALVKTTVSTGPFMYGDQVIFDIEIFNQGNVDAYGVVVNDFIPCGFKWLANNEPTWTETGGIAYAEITGPIAAGDSVIVSITLEVQACASDSCGPADPDCPDQGAWVNISEIESYKNEDGEDIAGDDIDSEADNNPTNDNMKDNVNDNTDGDEDDNDPEEILIFDLAQIKKIVTPMPYKYGDTIEYSICVVNQGNITATDITITDYLPEGLGFDVSLNNGWIETSTDIIEHTIDGPLLREDTICVPIFLTIDMTMGGGNDHTNISEITSAKDQNGDPVVDADSTADDDPDNDGEITNDSYHDEEDDHDNADLMVVDVALVKTTDDEGPFSYGDQITFDVEIFNQGNIDLYNVVVNDFVPCGYEWVAANSPIWSFDVSTGIATTSIPGPIVAGDSIKISKLLTIQDCNEAGAWTNVAEVESMQDEAGEDITNGDVDSNADTDPKNDVTQDNVNDNTNGDEDDNDLETIDIYDLSQEKTLITKGPHSYGDTLEFNICVSNQGNLIADTITITDYLPAGLGFISVLNPDWDATNAPAYDYEITNALAPQDSVCFPIFVTLESTEGGSSSYTNITEITMDDGEDADSEEDDDPDNDPEEEDDHDDEIVEVVDLALVKTTNSTGPFKYGDQVTFDIEVFNQGNVDAYEVVVNDFLPCGYKWLASNEPDWTIADTVATTEIAGPIAAGSSVKVSITLEVQACVSDIDGLAQNAWENISEIESFKDVEGEDITQEDIDSEADDDPTNDETEDNINDNTNDDEDDNDPEEIEVFDLAQIKKIVTEGPYMYGDTIEYSICVVNQGNITAKDISITDYLPEGLGFDTSLNTGWAETSTDIIEYTIVDLLSREDTICIPIFLTIDMTMGGGTDHTNVSEITSANDEDGSPREDADSTPDNDPDNDGEVTNDSYHDEEDDHDNADLMVVDVALVKSTTDEGPFSYGDEITFDIEVFNQGNIDLYNVVVNDFIPCGYEWVASNSPLWSYDASTGVATTIITGPITAGDSVMISKALTIQSCNDSEAWTNVAEVESMQDESGEDISDQDVDSDADDDPTNDNVEDGVNDNTNGDEDDHDPESIDIYDLSQDKTLLTEGPYKYGDTLEYSICVANQGNVAANNITVTDYLPSGLGFISALNPDWDDSSAPAYDYEIDTPLAPQDSICFSIFVTLESTSGGDDSYTNVSEITNDDGEDADSKEDDDPDNDPEEEDDQDEEKFEVFDLAMLKRISNQMPSEGFTFGDLIMYDMVVYNQGNVAAYNVQVCDFIPIGYNYDGAINPNWDGSGPAPTTVCTVIEGPINPGDSVTVMIQMELMNLGSNSTIDDYKNVAEIGRAENEDGEEQEDTDSDSDKDPGNDGEEKDDEINGEDGDEDDHDLALPFFMDLAMKKTLAEDYGNVAPGDIITYNLTLFNQGTIDAYNIEVTDHLSPGLTLSTGDINGWDDSSAPSVTKIIAGPLLAGDSLIVQIDVLVGSYIKTGDYKNIAEISNYEDKDGDKPDDYDSTSDDDPVNDGEMVNDAVEGENGDEDDGDYEDLSTFDLALIKQVATPGPYQTRDIIEFVISVVNQGNVPATEIVVADHVPPGFSFDAEENVGWDDSGAPTYLSVIDGPLMPTDTTRISIFLEIEYLEDATDLDYVNVAEISSAKDVTGNPVDDADSHPDSDPNNDGDSVDDSFDDKDDEDDHDPAGIPSTGLLPPCIPSCDIACVGQLNLSLGEACESLVSPSMLLAGLDNACDDPAFMDYFIMELKDERGVPIVGNLITADLVGELITYSITVADEIDDDDGTCTNTCWGNILVESKFTPVLDCGVEIDTISCIELPIFDGPPLSGSGTTGCFTADISIEILNEQIINVDPCEGDLVKKVIRQYQAVDVSGGRSNICTQELHITKLDPAMISIPVSISVNLSCNEEIGAIEEEDIRVGVVPFYTPETGSGIPLYPATDNFCNIFVEYIDEVIVDLPCKKQVLRTWEIRQWHCNDEDVISVPPQILTLIDEKPPVLICPMDTIEVSTSGSSCTAKVLLPEISATDSCNIVSQIDMSYTGGFIENQNGGEITDIPVGLNAITYIGYDACGNSSSCQVHVKVVDNSAPVIICEKNTQVSITRTGEAHVPASVFDDGSYDACSSIVFSARRMELSCQSSEQDSSSLVFGDVVAFCCADVGTTQMVALKVIDHSGRENQCMVEVTVLDKNPPAIVAPPDITVSCEFVFDKQDLSVFGSIVSTEIGREEIVIIADSVSIDGSPFDGLLIGGCGAEVAEEVDMGNVNSCGTGLIERTFSITSNGATVSDKQSITVVSPVAFDPDRIVWPRDTMFFDRCTAEDLHPDNLPLGVDRPRLGEGVCELIGSSITDEQIFSADNDGLGCVKVLRKWSVINWCDTDIVTGLPARWDSIQTIGLENRTAPIITSCTDTAEVYNSFDANCNPVYVNLSATATDDCTDTASLIWTWTIDQDNDGTVDTSGVGHEVNAGFVPGTHKIIWYAEDLCGNISAPCSQYFEITNEKAAPAICLDHVVTDLVLMDLDFDGVVDTEMVEIWASDVIKEDSHPCGHALSYSFDKAGLQDSVIYGCGEVGFNSVMIYVTNLTNGTQSSCWTEIEVQDNNGEDLCAGLVGGNGTDADVSGLIMTESGEQIVETEVKMLGSELPDTKSDTYGEYAFNNMPIGGDYTIVPKKDINHLNGVSTLDLVLIQKHILGLDLLDSPYKMIAADINKSNGISAADIVQLRRLILGESDVFVNNESWRFVDELHVFDSQTNPWSSVIPSVYDINNLSSDMIADFVGVKVGDVTSNAKGDELVTAELRNSSDPMTFIGQVEQEGLFKVVEIRSGEFTGVNGFQTTISYGADQYEFVKIDSDALDISAENIGTRYASRGLLTWSWHSEVPLDVAAEDVLFRLYFRAKTSYAKPISLTSNSKITVQEAYLDGEVTDKVEIEMIAESRAGLLIVDQNEPNPWRESTLIGFNIPVGGEVQLRIYDNTGKLIRQMKDNYGIGYNEINIGRDIIPTSGIYLYEIQYKDQIEHKRMIVLD